MQKIQSCCRKFAGIKFLKSGVLEDLATLTFSNYFVDNVKEENKIYQVQI